MKIEKKKTKDEKKKTKGNKANGDDVEVSDIKIEAVNLKDGLNNQEIEKRKNKKHKKNKSEQSSADMESQLTEKVDEGHRAFKGEDISKMFIGEEGGQQNKKKKKRKMHEDVVDAHKIKSATDGKEVDNGRDHDYVDYPRKERKKKKLRKNVKLECKLTKVMAERHNNNRRRQRGNIDLAENQVVDGEIGAAALNVANRKDEKKTKN